MRRIFMIIALAALLPWSIVAQDARQRRTETIVADALNQLPAPDKRAFDEAMGELLSTGAKGITQVADMLLPSDKGRNALMEYALQGVVAYASAPGREAEKAVVREGLKQALETCTDNPGKAFLLTLLRMCGETEDAPVFIKYLNDSYLAEWAVAGLASIPGTEEVLLDLMQQEAAPKELLARAAGTKKMASAEPVLTAWLKDADEPLRRAICQSLAQCGTTQSIPTLRKAAKRAGYGWEPTDATASYLQLLQRLAEEGHAKEASAAAKKLLGQAGPSHVKGAALRIIVTAEGKKALPLIASALKSSDRAYRVNALRLSEDVADEKWHATVAGMLQGKADATVKEDILNWMGTNHVTSQADAVVAQMDSPEESVALAAIKAAGKIGGDKALQALAAQLKGPRHDAAEKALLSFNGTLPADIPVKRPAPSIKAADPAIAIPDIRPTDGNQAPVPSPKFTLPAEEAEEGFEVLFDGEDLSLWTGNTTNYVPREGAICVSANYGSGGNLYTKKQYSDFIFRFEFCFMKEGVNNGVGIRTPMGVDAAYEGMEIQILDHDAPIYKNLREYQVHGSVYGIIPAKRIKSPRLGTWNTEEIMVRGDHIRVTVNGEVILDGNIREACQGHNVAGDGSNSNPHTVDGKNHPGLFNKSGHIGFLGHGEGLKLRNIRIKDLSK